ncbi:hypothetical protein [Aequorivita sp. Q41]|uniref:hypothetical protein n=1 Tax=Aequorivita sp. Q41 TaxID=3153300 RepID=UPI003241E8F7
MDSLAKYKKIIKWVFWLTLLLISYLTLQAIYETDDWQWFNMDFNKRDHIIGAYGTLIGGVLAFLSILFILYQVYEQREQINEEKNEAEIIKKEDLKDRLLLLSVFLKTVIVDLIKNGENMEEFYNAEQSAPSTMNRMYFIINKNFQRITALDDLSMYRAIKMYFKDEEDWQKQFLNLYSIIDFYSEALVELRDKYSLHINDKVSQQKTISTDMQSFLTANARLVDDYLIKYGSEKYLKYPWPTLINDFTPDYYEYIEEMQDNGKVPDFRYLSDNLFKDFIVEAMNIRRDYGYDDLGSRNIVELVSSIRKKIWEVELYSLQYADDIEKQYKNYFTKENDFINQLKEIKKLIDTKVK